MDMPANRAHNNKVNFLIRLKLNLNKRLFFFFFTLHFLIIHQISITHFSLNTKTPLPFKPYYINTLKNHGKLNAYQNSLQEFQQAKIEKKPQYKIQIERKRTF